MDWEYVKQMLIFEIAVSKEYPHGRLLEYMVGTWPHILIAGTPSFCLQPCPDPVSSGKLALPILG